VEDGITTPFGARAGNWARPTLTDRLFPTNTSADAGVRASSGVLPCPCAAETPCFGVNVEIGPVSTSQAAAGQTSKPVTEFCQRLARATGRAVGIGGRGQPNVHVLFYSEDDRDLLPQRRARQLCPGESERVQYRFSQFCPTTESTVSSWPFRRRVREPRHVYRQEHHGDPDRNIPTVARFLRSMKEMAQA